MCLMVWIGTAEPVPQVACAAEPDAATGYYRVEAVDSAAPIRARFASPHVTYVGSHEGCGCGFNSDTFVFDGIADVAEAMSLLDATAEEERVALLAEQRSRVRLHDVVCAALAHGGVEVYCCWAGDEHSVHVGAESVDASWLIERLAPLEERVRYVVRR